MTTAFIVKHVVRDRGPYFAKLLAASFRPYSYTSKRREAFAASKGAPIYIVEVHQTGRRRAYRLACKYLCDLVEPHPEPGRWDGKFKYRNSTSRAKPAGTFLKHPPLIEHAGLDALLRSPVPGMISIPTSHESYLETLLCLPSADPSVFP